MPVRRAIVVASGWLALAVPCGVSPIAEAQTLTGTLVGSVRDAGGGVIVGADVRIESASLVDGPRRAATDERGQFRFLALPPGLYLLHVERRGFAARREAGIRIGAGSTVDRVVELPLAGLVSSLEVGAGPHLDARGRGVESRYGPDVLRAIPTRRASMFDFIRASPGISPTSLSSGTVTTISAFGSGTNENVFMIDGTNMTCPCNGMARAEVGVDFIQEAQLQSAGASVEFGNLQGAAVNMITRSGGNRFESDTAFFWQTDRLTSHPVRLPLPAPATGESAYARIKYDDLTTNLGGPLVANRAWFFAGYQYLRDYDSQPGTDPAYPRTYEQNKFFGKLTWQPAPGWSAMHSLHYERWVNPERATMSTPPDATIRSHASVPAMTLAHLTRASDRTVWEVRAGRFTYDRDDDPSTGNTTTPGRIDVATGSASGAPRAFGSFALARTTVKSTVSHYLPGRQGLDQHVKVGAQVERGEHHAISVIPGGVRFADRNGAPFLAVESAPSNVGGRFITAGAFVSDAVTIRDWLTVDAGLRFDHNRAVSQDVRAVGPDGGETSDLVRGSGSLYTWNVVLPRVGLAARLTDDGRTMLRASYGRFAQGVLTGELALVHPGATAVTTTAYDPGTGTYSIPVSTVDPNENLRLDAAIRPPHTDELSVGVDRELSGRVVVSSAYVRKRGRDVIGWTHTGDAFVAATTTINGVTVPVYRLVSPADDRIFVLTNPGDYGLEYDGLVIGVEKRYANGWQLLSSYTLSRAAGLLPSSGAAAGNAQVSTVAPPPGSGVTFGRDPNDLTNARGRLPNDRPHLFRVMGSAELPGGFNAAVSLQHASGKPWAASGQVLLPQGNQRLLLETPGSRRLAAQTLLDVRVSRSVRVGEFARLEVALDLLNVLDDTAPDAIASDNVESATFGEPTVFMDPRRAMLSARLILAR